MKKISEKLARKIDREDRYVTRDYIYWARDDRLSGERVYERIARKAEGTTAALQPERVEVAR